MLSLELLLSSMDDPVAEYLVEYPRCFLNTVYMETYESSWTKSSKFLAFTKTLPSGLGRLEKVRSFPYT